jgi:serine/tyrosine/threonine adenylyltransferase
MDGIKFDNLALRVLPIDPVKENYVRSVAGACFSRVNMNFINEMTIVYIDVDVLFRS